MVDRMLDDHLLMIRCFIATQSHRQKVGQLDANIQATLFGIWGPLFDPSNVPRSLPFRRWPSSDPIFQAENSGTVYFPHFASGFLGILLIPFRFSREIPSGYLTQPCNMDHLHLTVCEGLLIYLQNIVIFQFANRYITNDKGQKCQILRAFNPHFQWLHPNFESKGLHPHFRLLHPNVQWLHPNLILIFSGSILIRGLPSTFT